MLKISHAVVTMDRAEALEESKRLITKDRHETHGAAAQHFSKIAAVWSVLLNQDLSATDVLLCLSALKLTRLADNQQHLDSYIDLIGYSALAAEISKAEA